MTFADIPVGESFMYDGDIFRKVDDRRAWEIRCGRKWKEWAFNPEDEVK